MHDLSLRSTVSGNLHPRVMTRPTGEKTRKEHSSSCDRKEMPLNNVVSPLCDCYRHISVMLGSETRATSAAV